jgi:hypothetical protein
VGCRDGLHLLGLLAGKDPQAHPQLARLAASPPDSHSPASPEENGPALVLTYEKASATGSKSAYQQTISRKDLAASLAGKGPALLVGHDPGQ